MQLYKGTRRRSATKQIIGRKIASERETETESEERKTLPQFVFYAKPSALVASIEEKRKKN